MSSLENSVALYLKDIGNAPSNDPTALVQRLKGASEILHKEMNLRENEAFRGHVAQLVHDWLMPLARKLVHEKDAAFGAVVEECNLLFGDFVLDISLDVAVEVKDIARAFIAKSSSSRSKVSSLELLERCFRKYSGSQYEEALKIGQVEKSLVSMITQSSKVPSVVKHANICLGAICVCYPNLVADHADINYHYFSGQLNQQMMSKTRKPDFPIIEGCVAALDDFLLAFGIPEEDLEKKETLYEQIKKLCVKNEDLIRRTALRRALELFARHCHIFANFIIGDIRDWYYMLNDWAFSQNRDDHRIGWKAMLRFFKVSGKKLGEQPNEQAFRFLLQKYSETISDPSSTTKQVTLAVQGYGHIAKACKALNDGNIGVMMSTLVQRVENMFFKNSSFEDDEEITDKNIHLPSYMEALTSVVKEMDVLAVQDIACYESTSVLLISSFPLLPKQYHVFAQKALLEAIDELRHTDKGFSSDAVKNAVFQGVLESCSFPVVTKIEEERLENQNVISVKSFFPLWNGLFRMSNNRELLFDAVFGSIIEIIGSLNFSVTEEEMAPNPEDSDYYENFNLSTLYKATCAKDFTVMANLVSLVEDSMKLVPAILWTKWIQPFGFQIISISFKYPQVSGLYRLFAVLLRSCDELNYFKSTSHSEETNRFCFSSFQQFLERCLKISAGFEGDLFHATLLMCLEIPVSLARELVQFISKPIIRVFKSLSFQNLYLVEKSVNFLGKLQLGLESEIFDSLVRPIVPNMNRFLQRSKSNDIYSGNQNEAKSGPRRFQRARDSKKIGKSIESRESELDRTQEQVLLFLGGLNMTVLKELLPSLKDLGHNIAAIDTKQCLTISLPFPDENIDVSLEVLLPRVLELSSSSVNRKTRIAACELLHVIFIHAIGKSATRSVAMEQQKPMTSYFARIFPVLIKLAGDEDNVIQNIFGPLLLQSVHWFTRSSEFESSDTVCLLDSIMDGLCDAENSANRKRSAELLSEFLKWSIKQTSLSKMEKAPYNPTSIIRRLGAMWLHPEPLRRYAASLAFNSLYRRFREERALVSIFTFEITTYVLKSLALSDKEKDVNFGAVEEAKTCLQHLQRIIREKSSLFGKDDPSRKKFIDGKGTSIREFACFLLSLALRREMKMRQASIDLLYELTTSSERKKAFKVYLSMQKLDSEATFVSQLDQKAVEMPSLFEVNLNTASDALVGCIHVADSINLLLNSDILEDLEAISKLSNFNHAISSFINQLCPRNVQIKHEFKACDPKQLQEQCCTLILRIFDFITACWKKNQLNAIQRIWTEDLWNLFFLTVLDPVRIGFDITDPAFESGVEQVVSDFLRAYSGKTTASVPSPRSVKYFPKGDDVRKHLEKTFSKHCDRQAVCSFKGIISLAKWKLIEFSSEEVEDYIFSLSSDHSHLSQVITMGVHFILQSSKEHDIATKTLVSKYLRQSNTLKAFEKALIANKDASKVVAIETALECFYKNPDKIISFLARVMNLYAKMPESQQLNPDHVLMKHWYKLEEYSNSSQSHLMSILILIKSKVLIERKISKEIALFIGNNLKDPSLSLSVKNKAIELLPAILESDLENNEDMVKNFVWEMTSFSFPLSSTELKEKSPQQSDYIESCEKLMDVLDTTCSPSIFEIMSVIICREKDHICSSKWHDFIVNLLKGKAEKDQMALLFTSYYLFRSSPNVNREVKRRILENVLVPLLHGASNISLVSFFKERIISLIEAFSMKLSGSEQKRLDDLNQMIGSCKIVGAMYGRLSRELVHSSSSEIARICFPYLTANGLAKSNAEPGTALGKYLLTKLVSFRSEVIDGSDELLEQFRTFQCSAYNAVISLISCLQDSEKFYTNFIFKENSTKSEYIWARIIPNKRKYDFHMEVDSLSRKKQQIVSVRASKVKQDQDRLSWNSNTSSMKTMASHYLNDSSLSQDVSMFDFHQSVASVSSQRFKNWNQGNIEKRDDHSDENFQNSIGIQSDDINEHECMAPLLAVIDLMTENRYYEVPSQTDGDHEKPKKLPEWMQHLIITIKDERSSSNTKYFILKVILNRPEVFRPFSHLLGPDLLSLAASETVWETGGTTLNSLRLDLITLLLSWSDRFVPKNLFEKSHASAVLELLLNICNETARSDILKYINELINTLVTNWSTIRLPITTLKRHLIEKKDNPKASKVILQILSIFLKKGSDFLNEVPNLMRVIVGHLDKGDKRVANQAAEVIGLGLQNLREDKEKLNLVKDLFNERVSKFAKCSTQKDTSNYMEAIYFCHKHYPSIVQDHYTRFIYDLKRMTGIVLNQSLEMLLALSETLSKSENGLRKEFSMMNIKDFLNHYDYVNQIACLEFLTTLGHQFDDELVHEYLREVKPLRDHQLSSVRRCVYNFLKVLFIAHYQKEEKSIEDRFLEKECLTLLTYAFGDSDGSIVDDIKAFFEEKELLPKTTPERLLQLFRAGILNKESQDDFLRVSCSFLLKLAEDSPRLEAKIYSEPLSSTVHFQKQHINTSWRAQSSQMTPMFVETLFTASQIPPTLASQIPGFLRATQRTLEFEPTQGLGQPSELSAATQGLSATQAHVLRNRGQLVGQAGQVEDGGQASGQGLILGKRFVKPDQMSFDKTKAYFAKMHATREKRLNQLAEDRKGMRLAQINLRREYRVGELPDIEIKYADIVKPLANLCDLDDLSARLVFRLLSKQILKATHRTRRNFEIDLASSLNDHLKDNYFQNSLISAAVLDLGTELSEKLQLDTIVHMCRSLHLEPLGILLLEKQLEANSSSGLKLTKRNKTTTLDSNEETQSVNLWLKMLDLFRAFDDPDSARGIVNQNFQNFPVLMEALAYESLEKWNEAKSSYQELIDSHMESSETNLTKFWQESYLNSIEKLSKWEELSLKSLDHLKNTFSMAEVDKSEWKKEFVFRHFFEAQLHLLVDRSSKVNRQYNIFNLVKNCNDGNIINWLQRNFGLDMAMLYVSQNKRIEARAWMKKYMNLFTDSWTKIDDLNRSGSKESLTLLKRLSLVHDCLSKSDSDENLLELVEKKWSLQETMNHFCSLQSVDHLLRDERALFKDQSFSEFHASQLLSLTNESNTRRQFDVSSNALSLVHSRFLNLIDKAKTKDAYEVLYADTVAVKFQTSSKEKIQRRLGTVCRYLLTLESKKTSAHYLTAKTRLIMALEKIISEVDESKSTDEVLEFLNDPERKAYMKNMIGGCESSNEIRARLLWHSLETFEAETSSSVMLSRPSTWMDLSDIAYRLYDEFHETDEKLLLILIKSHLRAIAEGSLKAKKLFPNLIRVMNECARQRSCTELFKDEAEKIESWMFLPWVNQMVSIYISDPASSSYLENILINLSKDFPYVVRWPYFLSRDGQTTKASQSDVLENLLKMSPLCQKIIYCLSSLSVPEVVIKDELAPLRSVPTQISEKAKNLKAKFEQSPGIFGPAYKRCIVKYLSQSSMSSQKASKLLENIDKDLRTKKMADVIGDYVPFLQDFHSFNYEEKFEIPGQIDGFQKPKSPDFLMCFKAKVRVFRSIRKPISLTMLSESGKKYVFIVKCGEDLRQDQRIQQVFSIANNSFQSQGYDMEIQTYKVIPLTTTSGLIECLGNTCPYGDLAKTQSMSGIEKLVGNQIDYEKLLSLSVEQRIKDFEKLLNMNSNMTLKQNFIGLSNSTEGFFFFRKNFIRSHALHSIVGWLLSIGDRHADNFLINLLTGESIAIDFGYSFGTTAFLPVPEMVPFRLTPQIQTLVKPFRNQGQLRETMIKALECLRIDSSILMAGLELFIREPTVDWMKFARRRASLGNNGGEVDLRKFSEMKINVCKKKLQGQHPSLSTLTEINHAWSHEKGKKFMNPTKTLLLGQRDSLRHKLAGKSELSVTEQVDCLLEASTDMNILRCAFRGWSPLN